MSLLSRSLPGILLIIAGCAAPPPYRTPSTPAPPPAEQRPQSGAGPFVVRPAPNESDLPPSEAPPMPEERAVPAARTYALSPATESLVAQARSQSQQGAHAAAAGTVERAIRIEPDNPLLWIELGRVRLAEGNAAQAESLGRKAALLASGDARAESTAWKLVAESLQARGRTAEAMEAEARATALATR